MGPWLHHPGTAAYRESEPWNRAVLSQPRAVALVQSADEVAAAIQYTADHALQVAVRCTGHGATPLDGDTLLVQTTR